MRELAYLDDAAYARFFVEARQAATPRSRRALAFELSRKGVDRELATEAVAELSDADAAYEAARGHLPQQPRLRLWRRAGDDREVLGGGGRGRLAGRERCISGPRLRVRVGAQHAAPLPPCGDFRPHRQALQPAENERGAPLRLAGRLRQAAQQRLEGDLRLGGRQRRAEAVVDAVAEGEMAVVLPADVEAIGVREPPRGAAGGGEHGEDELARLEALA